MFVVLGALAGATAPTAAADTLTITPPSDATAETAVPVVLSGERSEATRYQFGVDVYAVSGASTCNASSALASVEYSGPHAWAQVPFDSTAPFSVTANLFVERPGTYLLCGYFGQLVSSVSMAVGSSAKEAAEQTAARAKEAAEQAAARAREAAERAPATRLEVKLRSHHGGFYGEPGHTDIFITATPYAHLAFTADHGLGKKHWRQPGGKAGEDEEEANEGEVGHIIIRWSCRHPGETVHYSVQALGGSGSPLVRREHFKEPLSRQWCAAAKRREQREATEERQHQAEERREEAAQRRHAVEHFETNCRAIGGTPVEISTSEGRQVVCRSKNGGIIPVPT